MPTQKFFYPDPNELTLVVRAAGERTEKACVELFRQQLPDPNQLHVIHEKPFSTAVLQTFEQGIASGRPWLIAIDADILPLPDALERAREICGKMAPQAFCATPLFLCRTVGGFAMRGLHCYRVALLDEAIRLTPSLPTDLRPESRYHDAMRTRGYTREIYAKVLGLHEYEQSFRHIYLKSMLRCRKDAYVDQIRHRLVHDAPQDHDARVALWGFDDANTSEIAPAEYDWDAPLERFEARMRDAGMTEKPPLDRRISTDFVLSTLLGHPFREDRNTEAWIRDMHRFSDGAPDLRRLLQQPSLFTNPALHPSEIA